MRFSTKILTLTLAITLGLSGVVFIAVRSQLTAHETARARQDIARAADQFDERVNARQERLRTIVEREMLDPQYKALLDQFTPSASAELRASAAAQLDYLFSTTLGDDPDSPKFQMLFDRRGQAVVTRARDDEQLQKALSEPSIPWRSKEMLAAAVPTRQYLWIGRRLFLAFGLPLRQTTHEDPTFAYYGGFEVTDEWIRPLMKQAGDAALMAWFAIDGQVVARAASTPDDARIWQALHAQVGRGESSQEVVFEVDDKPFVGRYSIEHPATGVQLAVAQASSLYDHLAPLRQLRRQIAWVTLFCAIIAVNAALWLTRRLSRPVEQLVAGTQRIAQGDFSQPIRIDRRDELGTLARSFNVMSDGLAQRDVIKDSLGQFVDPRIADLLLTNPQSLQGKRAVQSVLFSDLEKFTTLSERLSPEQLVKLLNAYLGSCADVVKELNGYLDKFSGDGVVAFWGPPVETNHALAACRAALRMVELTKQFRDPPLRVRVGIATGEVIVGIIGSQRSKKNYTALGDVVNLAARLEGANKVYGTQILVDAATAEQVRGSLVTRRIDTVRVVGRSEPVVLHEVLGERSATVGNPQFEIYADALNHYASGRWSEASRIFASIPDAPARVMQLRCERLIESPRSSTWDGVWNLEVK